MAPSKSAADIKWLDKAESTNKALREALPCCDNLSVIAAVEQLAGRGQGSHSWHSLRGLNLTFSILLRPSALPAGNILLITYATTLGILDYLSSKGVVARIKWPNDIWVGDKKICGILIENSLAEGLVCASIIGVGFNLNQVEWPSELPNPVSLKELTGKDYDLREELVALTDMICRRFTTIGNSDGESELQEEFGKNVFRLP